MALRQTTGMLLRAQRTVLPAAHQQLAAAGCSIEQPTFLQMTLPWNAGLGGAGSGGSWLTRLFANATTGEGAAGAGKASAAQQSGKQAAEGEASTSEPGAGSQDEGAADVSVADLQALLLSRDEEINQLKDQLNDITDAYKRNLAEMENLRERTRREIDTAKKFAIQGFVKSLLDVADNMGRALEAVPAREEGVQLDVEKAVKLLNGLQEGVQATEKILLQLLRQNGIEQYNPLGDPFDPNRHMAMFEVPDPTQEAGTVAVVTKRGYTMHDRVLRAAEVGVVKAQAS